MTEVQPTFCQHSAPTCTTFHRYPIFSTRYSVMCKVYTGYCGTSEIEHGLCACTVDNPLAKARGLSLRTGAQPMLYLPLVFGHKTDTNLNQVFLYRFFELGRSNSLFRIHPRLLSAPEDMLYSVLSLEGPRMSCYRQVGQHRRKISRHRGDNLGLYPHNCSLSNHLKSVKITNM